MVKACVMMLGALAGASVLGGCSSAPAERTGFISYDHLGDERAEGQFISEQLGEYNAFIVDPIDVYTTEEMDDREVQARQDLAVYATQRVAREIGTAYAIVSVPGPGVGRVRFAVTNVAKSVPILNIHPGMKLTGAGLGGAAVEGEIVDSQTGDQLFAIVEARRGSQMELDTFDEWDDARDAVDAWAVKVRKWIDEAHAGTLTPQD